MNPAFDPGAQVTVLLNIWLEETRGMPMTLQLTRLTLAIRTALQAAYDEGVKATMLATMNPYMDNDDELPKDDLVDDEHDEPGMHDEFDLPPRHDVQHPTGETQACPDCHQPMIFGGVVKTGNVLSTNPFVFSGRWDCDACLIMLATEIDQVWAAAQWAKQGNSV